MAYGSTHASPLASVTVNNTTIPQVTYKGQPVLSSAAVAEVHGISKATVDSSFHRNRYMYEEGEDYFKVPFAEWKKLRNEDSPLFRGSTGHGILLFTKRGYLMLVKSLNDKVSWQAQRTLVDSYFELQEVKTVLKETGGVYVAPEAVDDDNTLLFAKALKAADIMLAKRDAQIAEMHTKMHW